MNNDRWVRSPAWRMQLLNAAGEVATSAAQAQHVLISAGADETYWVDELPDADAVRQLHAAWSDNTLHTLRDDPRCGAAVRQLRRLGALLPEQAVQPVRRFALCWWGVPDRAWEAELSRQLAAAASSPVPGLPLQHVGVIDESVDFLVYIRSSAGWINSLADYSSQFPKKPHVLLDLAYHHSVVLGPWVLPGQTACLACSGLRTVRRWGDAVVPSSPLVMAAPALSVALLLQVLCAVAEPGGQAAWVEHSLHLDAVSLRTQRARVFRQPGCPACGHMTDDGCAAEAHDGRVDLQA